MLYFFEKYKYNINWKFVMSDKISFEMPNFSTLYM